MTVSLSNLTTSVQRSIADMAIYVPNESLGIGDASKTVFYIKFPPMEANSLKIYLDDVLQSTGYVVDNDYGSITFTSAPSSNEKVSVDYKGLAFHTSDLENLVTESVEDFELIYPAMSFSIDESNNVDPDPSQKEKRFLILQSRVNFLFGQARRWASEAIRTATTGLSEDTGIRATVMQKLYEQELKHFEYYVAYAQIYGAISSDDELKF